MTYDGRIEAQFTVPAGVTLSATNSGGGPTSVPVNAGTYYISDLVTQVVAQLNATRTPANWSGSLSTGASGTGKVTLNYTGTGTYSISWTSTVLRDVLGFTANLTAVTQGVASTGSSQARGLWLPDTTLNLDGDVPRAPIVTDVLACVGPRGDQVTLVGNKLYRHTGLVWTHVPQSKVWESAATITNASWETFWKDAHLGQGSISWFSPGSKLKIIDHAARTLGSDASISGWTASKGPNDTEVKPADKAWRGYWMVQIPELIASS